ncbi:MULTISPECIES: NADH:flavin oxidoreductase [unclassified Rhodococcus (in: high G+C Gram-positive bacteria)]|uniref:oxidoreductase n=1 Tax=unclassified Rhodococcus (in: high G+C Gram-positive bacteria) TaxID=192944 RepID=UPI0006F1E12E|nr:MULTISPECIES: NADH:flavin oxidoreductase [unclassified Rhodococcus (in: high G+C Gram-positive bacteria)]KQU38441.1 hypothetical protein ASG69_15125 [Rhodococcus sp. Leaf225]KQU39804.1 hypothetical protein ASH03_20130 [Rhodococcus sp. Leaf258]
MNDIAPYGSLFTPFHINRLRVANRIIMGPMAVLQPHADGTPSDQTRAFLTERARGGVGMIIVGGSAATARGVAEAPFSPLLRFDNDSTVPPLRRVTDAVHEHETPIVAQIFSGFGRMGNPGPGRPILAASARNVHMSEDHLPPGLFIPGGRVTPTPEEATERDIAQVQRDVVAAAARARSAGFDGIEIAAHMCYFYSSFLSPLSNRRTDQYGGDAANRARILVDVLRALRSELGSDYPIGLRMSVNDHMQGGQGPEGFADVAAEVARAGIDYIAMTDGNYESMDINVPSESGTMLEHGEPAIFRSKVGDVPLFLSSTYDPRMGAAAIESGQADALMLARQLLADPAFADKLKHGREDEIVWCDHQNSCLRRLILNVPVRCHQNPTMGREAREPGQRPPFSRVLRRPVEDAVIGLAGSTRVMGIASKLAAKKGARARRQE